MRFQFLVMVLTALIVSTSASAHEIIKGKIKFNNSLHK